MKKHISIPKENRHDERRVALLPQDLSAFVEHDFEIHVETGAGTGIGYSDDDYRRVGAAIVSHNALWSESVYIAKLLCPLDEELALITEQTHVSAFFYAGEHYKLIQKMSALQINAYSYEYFEERTGEFPMMAADGWLSGRLAVMNAAFYLQTQHGGRGVVLGGMDAEPHCNIVVIGYGNVGDSAVQTALSLGAQVTVIGRNAEGLSAYAHRNPDTHCVLVDDPAFEQALLAADMVIGAILISTYDTPALLTDSLVGKMKSGAIIVDVTCGYGVGYMPTADKITMPGVGPYLRHEVLHLKNPRLPAMTPISAAHNASRLYAPYLLALGEMIFDDTKICEISTNGQILKNGKVIHPHVLSDFDRIESGKYKNYELLDHLVAP